MKKIKVTIEYQYEPFIEPGDDVDKKLKKIKGEEEVQMKELKDLFLRNNRFKPMEFKSQVTIS